MPVLYSFLWLNHYSTVYIYHTLFIHGCTWIASPFWFLRMMWLWAFVHRHLLSFPLGGSLEGSWKGDETRSLSIKLHSPLSSHSSDILKLANSPNSIYSSWLPLSAQDRALPGECGGGMVLSEPFASHAEISMCFIPPGAPALGPLGSEEAEPPSRDRHPGRLPHPFSHSGWHQATSHANVWGFSHGSPEFWQGLHSASL